MAGEKLISQSAQWRALTAQAKALEKRAMTDLFAADPERPQRFSAAAAGLYLDYSKNKITAEAFSSLLDLARAAGLEAERGRLFAGEAVNATEGRAVLHVALRAPEDAPYTALGAPVMAQVQRVRDKMRRLSHQIESGARRGFTGARLDTVVNIGIGGSDLGPAMAAEALKPYWREGRSAHFVSNVDAADLAQTLSQVDPARTLFLIASKTFTTQETMTNAKSARDWLLAQGAKPADIARHFAALSTNRAEVEAFGIDADNMFEFWDWVGGRFSLWSAIGLSVALTIGYDNFERLLAGAHAMDEHFRSAPLEQNMPAILALIGVWNANFLGAGSHAVVPYDQYLRRLPAYLQQAEMESNGKQVTLSGLTVDYATAPIVWGEPGTNAQHSFFQLLHQGARVVSTDFIVPAKSHHAMGDHHAKLLANALAQMEALMRGRTRQEAEAEMMVRGLDAQEAARLAPHRAFPGGRPSNAILLDQVTPERLGALIALYEHKIFCQGVIWGVNSFDQWGVELGKELARRILPKIDAASVEARSFEAPGDHDASTQSLIARLNAMRAGSASEE